MELVFRVRADSGDRQSRVFAATTASTNTTCWCATEGGRSDTQLECVRQGYRQALAEFGLDAGTATWRRFFCSDLAGQAARSRPSRSPIHTTDELCAVSWVGQTAAPPAKVALWAYHVRDPAGALDKRLADATLTWRRKELAHHWTTGVMCPGAATSYEQTRSIFERYYSRRRMRRTLSCSECSP